MAYGREVRIGLVLYGGVSLAVYENGIAQELYRAIRKQGVYGLLSRLIDSDVIVDVISGTSAGGDNGIMLAYALANGKNFIPAAELWRNQGDIERLMRARNDPNSSSVLDSTYYQDRLAECFATQMTDDSTAPAINELDLFITSTDANGAISTVYDELGHAIDLKNHRALFKLSFRQGRKNDFSAPAEDLAKLSRMTSCFPVAFEPVRVGDGTEDDSFRRWGKLQKPAVFLDGGILNNKPFTSTIEAIAGRLATREVERFLVYVEPKPEQFAPSAGPPESPSMMKAGMDSLISIPGYQSIAGDLAAVEAHNQRAAKVAGIMKCFGRPKSSPDCLLRAGVVFEADPGCDYTAYEIARFMQLRDVAVEAILNYPGGRAYFATPQVMAATGIASPQRNAAMAQNDRRSGRLLVQSFDAWPGSGADTLRKYDVFFRMRRAMYLSESLMRFTKHNGVVVPASVWNVVNHFFQAYEVLRWAMVQALTIQDFGWQQLSTEYPDLDTQPEEVRAEALAAIAQRFWGQVDRLLDNLMHADIPLPAETTDGALKTFYAGLEPLIKKPVAGDTARPNLLIALDDAFKKSLTALMASPGDGVASPAALVRDEFCRFLDIDRQLFLLQVGSDFESTDVIRVVRFSPLDAQRGLSKGEVRNKVRGSVLAAFGGFFKKSWRANDIMVGRLDAACLLTECLLTKERLASLAQKPGAVLPNVTLEELSGCFPNRTNAQLQALSQTINDYLGSPVAATPEQWEKLIDAIVEAAHDEIFRDEYPNVVRCAVEQEADWGRYQVSKTMPGQPTSDAFNRDELVWYRAKKRPDQVLVDTAAEALATGHLPEPFAPGCKQAGTFLDDLPNAVLQELTALATMRLGDGLVASFPAELQAKVKCSKLYRVPFAWVAPIVYRYARLRRTQPDTVIVLNTMLIVACSMAVALAILLPLWGMPVTLLHLIIVILVASAALFIWALWFRR